MSLNLYWQPVDPPPPGNYLGGHPLKGLIVDAYGEHDGSLREEIILSKENIGELRVLQRTHQRGDLAEEIREGLQQIIDAISRHGLIRLYLDE